jgi:hypothetical protein
MEFKREKKCASNMEQRSSYAEMRDAQILLSREECALDMLHEMLMR